MTRVRVLWLIKGLGPGGAERLLVSAATVADHDRFSFTTAFVLPHKTSMAPALAAEGVECRCLARISSGKPWPLALRSLLLEEQYDVLHMHSPMVAGIARLVVRTIAPSRRPEVVSTEHNTWPSYSLGTRLLNALLYNTDRRRWAVSRRVRDSIWRPLRSGVEVLVHGVVPSDVVELGGRDTVRAELGLSDRDVVGITVANFRTEKAYPDLLRAARIAFDREPRLRLCIVGQGPLEDQIRNLHSELGLGDRCMILGYRSDVMNLLVGMDFFVLSSHHEGFPIALMEALASGLPAVVTDVGGVADAVTHTQEGYVVDAGDYRALAAAMVEMVQDDAARAAMGSRATVRGQNFDISLTVRTLEAAYADLAESRRERLGE